MNREVRSLNKEAVQEAQTEQSTEQVTTTVKEVEHSVEEVTKHKIIKRKADGGHPFPL